MASASYLPLYSYVVGSAGAMPQAIHMKKNDDETSWKLRCGSNPIIEDYDKLWSYSQEFTYSIQAYIFTHYTDQTPTVSVTSPRVGYLLIQFHICVQLMLDDSLCRAVREIFNVIC